MLLRISKEKRKLCNETGLNEEAKQRRKLSKAFQSSNKSVVDLWAVLADSKNQFNKKMLNIEMKC